MLPYGPNDIARDAEAGNEEAIWFRANFTWANQREAAAMFDLTAEKNRPIIGLTEDGPQILRYFYNCRWFDRDTRSCTNYDDRPPMCRDYPHYGHAPNPAKALPVCCSFRADVGQPVADIPVQLRPKA